MRCGTNREKLIVYPSQNAGTCSGCTDGYVLIGRNCRECEYPCATCKVFNECITCATEANRTDE